MSIPLLSYPSSTQNSRIAGYEVAGDDQPVIFSSENLLSDGDFRNLVEAAYRQIYFHAFKSDREPFLESQLRSGQITVREFIRGLLLSDTYNKSFYNLNSNYRFVEQTVQRVLGRDIYDEREKLAWSIVVATKGKQGFVDDLLGSDEYLDNFGDDIVPYQRRRNLPGRAEGEIPFNVKSPRYNEYYRGILGFPQIIFTYDAEAAKKIRTGTTTRAGDPAEYLEMAKGIALRASAMQAVTASGIGDYMSKVPSRTR